MANDDACVHLGVDCALQARRAGAIWDLRLRSENTDAAVLQGRIGLTASLLGAFPPISRDVGNHAFVECDLLHLTWHVAQIDQEPIHVGHPHQRVLIQ
jgi:hypothetical protein